MKKMKLLTLIVCTAVVSLQAAQMQTSAVAQAPSAQAKPARVMVVQLQEVGQKSLKFKDMQGKIEKKINDKVTEFKALETQFSQKLEKLQTGAKDMNPSAQQKLQEELASLKGQLEVKQRSIQAAVESEMRVAEEKLIEEVQAICKRLGYDIVIPGAISVKDEYNCTAQVIAEMDRGFSKPEVAATKKIETAAASSAPVHKS